MSNNNHKKREHIPDLRTYAFHQKAAEILVAHPERLEDIYITLQRWSERTDTQAQGWAHKWLEMIEGMTAAEVAEFIVQKGERMDFYRKSSPFACLLTYEQRIEILQRYKFDYENR